MAKRRDAPVEVDGGKEIVIVFCHLQINEPSFVTIASTGQASLRIEVKSGFSQKG
jgi:hypothetical protein